MNLEAQAMVSK